MPAPQVGASRGDARRRAAARILVNSFAGPSVIGACVTYGPVLFV